MFDLDTDERLSAWLTHRQYIEQSENPFQDIWEFWKSAPFIPYNNKLDPYHQRSWPSPWEIIVNNKYDDFTKSVMIGWTIKLTKRFENSKVEIRTLVDKQKILQYNVIYINDEVAINYSDNGPIDAKDIPDTFLLENIVELTGPR
jgi:hypothetical protein